MDRSLPYSPSKFGCRISEKMRILHLKLFQHIWLVELMVLGLASVGMMEGRMGGGAREVAARWASSRAWV